MLFLNCCLPTFHLKQSTNYTFSDNRINKAFLVQDLFQLTEHFSFKRKDMHATCSVVLVKRFYSGLYLLKYCVLEQVHMCCYAFIFGLGIKELTHMHFLSICIPIKEIIIRTVYVRVLLGTISHFFNILKVK